MYWLLTSSGSVYHPCPRCLCFGSRNSPSTYSRSRATMATTTCNCHRMLQQLLTGVVPGISAADMQDVCGVVLLCAQVWVMLFEGKEGGTVLEVYTQWRLCASSLAHWGSCLGGMFHTCMCPPTGSNTASRQAFAMHPARIYCIQVGSALRSPRSDAVGPKLACLGVWTVVGMEVESSRNI